MSPVIWLFRLYLALLITTLPFTMPMVGTALIIVATWRFLRGLLP